MKSDKLRRKLLESGKDLTLTILKEIAVAFEAVENQMTAMSLSEVNKVSYIKNFGKKNSFKANNNSRENTDGVDSDFKSKVSNVKKEKCFRCGQCGNFGRDKSCPAWGKVSVKCKGKDNFVNVCNTKNKKNVGLVQYTDRGDQGNSQGVSHDEDNAFLVCHRNNDND